MNKIAHRGNYAGIDAERENTIAYLREALEAGYYIECDVQTVDGEMFFGHDEPQEPVSYEILMNARTICHAKDISALIQLHYLNAHCFWHQEDTVTITSKGYIWCYPGIHPKYPDAIWLDLAGMSLPEDTSGIFGICSDDFRDSNA